MYLFFTLFRETPGFPEGETKVYIGYDHTPRETEGEQQTYYLIRSKHKHPKYNTTNVYFDRNDIALVQLNRPVLGNVKTICMPAKGIKPVLGQDEYLIMSGWGSIPGILEYRPLQVAYRVLVSQSLFLNENEFYHSSPDGSSKVCQVSLNNIFNFKLFILLTMPDRRWLSLMAVLHGKGCSHWHTV